MNTPIPPQAEPAPRKTQKHHNQKAMKHRIIKLGLTSLILAVAVAAATAFVRRDDPYKFVVPDLKLVSISPNDEALSEFRVSIFETTNAQFGSFLRCVGRGNDPWFTAHGAEPGNLPARDITRADTRAYCAWLTEVCRQKGVIEQDERFDLPTDSQFTRILGEKPSTERGTTPEERMKNATSSAYAHGPDAVPPAESCNVMRILDQTPAANLKGFDGPSDRFLGAAPVGSFPASADGVHDAGGNVREFLREDYNATHECARGACFSDTDLTFLRISARQGLARNASDPTVGFRVVLEPVSGPATSGISTGF